MRRRARAYFVLQDALPPPLFAGVNRGYTALRSAAGRNPGRGRILPDFLLIGAAKCGTTSLFDWLCAHPFVARPERNGRPRKELLYFDYRFARQEDWYRAHFPLRSERDAFEREHGRPFVTGEGTATYLTSYWAPQRVAELLGDVKLIACFRDPADRAYSAFQMSRRRGLELSPSFETALALEAERLEPEVARVRADPFYNPRLPPPLGYWSYLTRSRYAEHVERWFEFFPRERFLFLRFEDVAAEPQRELDKVHEFLGLPAHRHEAFPALNTGGDYEPMDPRTRAHLADYFRPHNERLRELTGIDLSADPAR